MTDADGDQPPHGAEAVEQGSDDPGDENASTRRNPNGHHATNARGGASEEARVPRCLKEGCSCMTTTRTRTIITRRFQPAEAREEMNVDGLEPKRNPSNSATEQRRQCEGGGYLLSLQGWRSGYRARRR